MEELAVGLTATRTYVGSFASQSVSATAAARTSPWRYTLLSSPLFERFLDTLPALTSLFVISFLVWGALFLPLVLTAFVLLFDAYWLFRSYDVGLHAIYGWYKVYRSRRADWYARYQAETEAAGVLPWHAVYHVVLIPNYTESVDKLTRTLDALAASEVADHIFVVLALEEREGDPARQRASALTAAFQDRFAGVFAAFHPDGLVGEVAGKSSNEAWAARWAKHRIVDELGYDLDLLTITSCDSDTVFSPKYFSCLTYKFSTHPNRYRRFYQGPIYFYNNIWEVPAPLRIKHVVSGFNHLGRLSRGPGRVIFPQSTYSLSLRMAHEVGYWDVDVVPEDWHMFLKCFFALDGEVDVEPMFIPVWVDGIRSHSYPMTFLSYYQQVRRWAWGCSDIPYAIKQCIAHPEIRLARRLSRVGALVQNHFFWSTQWFMNTVGREIPVTVALYFGFAGPPDWFPEASRLILMPCMAPLIWVVALDFFVRPRRPRQFPIWMYVPQYAVWPLLSPVSFIFGALAGLDAQIRLLLGKRLEYRVTEKA